MKMFKALLTKVESNHTNLRTNEMEGLTADLPEVGKEFLIFGKSLTEGLSTRMIHTTVIKEIEKNSEDEMTFKTQNSTYKLKVLGVEETDPKIVSAEESK